MISVGVPAYNAEKYLAITLNSVMAQSLADWECIIVNDGSKDSTPEIARAYAARDSRFRVVEKENGGLPAARDTLFASMNPASEAVLFLDADDVLEPDALATLFSALQSNPQAVAAHGTARYIDGKGRPDPPDSLEKWCRERRRIQGKRSEFIPISAPTDYAVLAYWTCLPTPGVLLIRRSTMEKAGTWDKNTPECADWDMGLRLSRFGDFVYTEKVLLNYRQHGTNMSGNPKKMRQAELYVRRKVLASPEFTPEQQQMMAQGFRLCERDRCLAKLAGAGQDIRHFRLKKAVFEALRACNNYRNYLFGLPKN